MYLLLLLSEEMLDAKARQVGGGLLRAAMGAIESGVGEGWSVWGGVGGFVYAGMHRSVNICIYIIHTHVT